MEARTNQKNENGGESSARSAGEKEQTKNIPEEGVYRGKGG